MSIQAVAAVLDADVGEVAAKMLLVCLANAHNSSTGICTPSIERLCRETSMSRRTVQKWIAWCEAAGLISVDERQADNNRQLSHGYRLHLGEGANIARVQTVAPSPVQTVAPLKPEEEPELSISSASARDGLTELLEVLDQDHAEALLDHFAGLGQPLSGYTASLKARQLDQHPDPNGASEEMILKGWHNFEPGWVLRDRRAGEGSDANQASAPLQTETLHLPADLDLVVEVERLLGKHHPQLPMSGPRIYVASLVQRARTLTAQAHA